MRNLWPLFSVFLLPLALPVHADAGWDFVVEYTVQPDGNVTFSSLVPMMGGMDCSAGWTTDSSAGTMAPAPANAVRIFGSYTQGRLRIENQNGWSMNVTTYTCQGSVRIIPATASGAAGFDSQSDWMPYFETDWSLAPSVTAHTTGPFVVRHNCVMAVFRPDGPIPFTGHLKLELDRREGETFGWSSGTWVAGMGVQLSNAESPTRRGYVWCAGFDPTDTFQPKSYADFTSAPGLRPIGHWRATLYYCQADAWQCRASASLVQ